MSFVVQSAKVGQEIKKAVQFQQYLHFWAVNVFWNGVLVCKRLRSPGIDSKESIPPANVAWARICKHFKAQESIPNLAGRYDNPICRTGPPDYI